MAILRQAQDKKNSNNQDKENLDYIEEAGLDIGQILATWEIPEFTKQEKSKKWFLYFIIIIIGLLIYSYFSSNFLFGIIIVFFSLMYWLLEKREAGDLEFAIAVVGYRCISAH